MNVHAMAAIWIGNIRPHVRDVVAFPFYPVGIQDISGLKHNHVDQLFHLGKSMDVVRRHVGKNHSLWRRFPNSRFLQFPKFFLDPVANADIGQLPREHRSWEKHEHLLRGQFDPAGSARDVKHRS